MRRSSLNLSGHGRLFDVWFSNCALDQGDNKAFEIITQQNARFGFVHIEHCYIVAFTHAFWIINGSSVDTEEIINGCTIGLVGTPFNLFNCQNVRIVNNSFKDVTQISSFSGACKNIQMMGNSLNGDTKLLAQCVELQSTFVSGIIKNNFGNFANSSEFVFNPTSLPNTALLISDNLQSQ